MEQFAKDGYRVGAYKPIETGVSDIPQDAKSLFLQAQKLNPDFKDLQLEDIISYTFKLPAAPFVAKYNTSIDIGLIQTQADKLRNFCDVLFIEGAGGLMVPIQKDFFMIDLIQYLDAKAYLITPSRLGCINDTLLSMQALERYKIDFEWFVNLYEDKEVFKTVTEPFYKDYFTTFRFV